MKQTLQEKRDEQQRLSKAYKANKREQWDELVEREPRLIPMRAAIRGSANPSELFQNIADSWVRFAPSEVRYAVLRMVDDHANRQARLAGRAILDDPLPPGRNLYHATRELLAVR